MSKKCALLYPFSKAALPCFYALQSSEEYQIAHIVSPKVCLGAGKDAAVIANRQPWGIAVENDFIASLPGCDAVVVPPFDERALPEVLLCIEYALEQGVQVLFLGDIKGGGLAALASRYPVIFCQPGTQKQGIEDILPGQSGSPFRLNELEVPLVYIGELMPLEQADELVIRLAARLRGEGYRVAAVTRTSGALFEQDNYALPQSIFTKDLSETEKVYALNRFYNNISNTIYPTIILSALPDAMLQYNQAFGNGFGIIPFLFSMAAKADFCVLLSAYERYYSAEHLNYFNALHANFTQRFGFGIDYIAMSNLLFDIAGSNGKIKPVYNWLPEEEVVKTLREKIEFLQPPIPTGYAFSNATIENIYTKIIEKLSGEAAA